MVKMAVRVWLCMTMLDDQNFTDRVFGVVCGVIDVLYSGLVVVWKCLLFIGMKIKV